MQEMPKPNKFILSYYGQSAEVEPDNHADIELLLSRADGHGVDKAFTTDFTFSRSASKIFQALDAQYGKSTICTMSFYKRDDSQTALENGTLWNMVLFATLSADFSTYSLDNGIVSISFTENSVRKQIDDNKSTDYDIPLNDTIPATGAQRTLLYTGVTTDASNQLTGISGNMEKLTGVNKFLIQANHSTSAPSTTFNYFNDDETVINYMRLVALKDNTPTIEVKLGTIIIKVIDSTPSVFQKIRLVKILLNGSHVELFKWVFPSWYQDLTAVYYTFADDEIHTINTVEFIAGETLAWMFESSVEGDAIVQSIENNYLKVVSVESTVFVTYPIKVCTYKWLLQQILLNIAPACTLNWLLPDADDELAKMVTCLSSSSALAQMENPYITSNFDKIMKALSVEYSAGYKIEGSTITVCRISEMYTDVKAMDVLPIEGVVENNDDTHVFGRVVVGYETDDDVENGTLEFNCKNTFTIPNTLANDKELNLVHPFKGGCYTIEKFLKNKKQSSTTTQTSDNKIFVFSVDPFVEAGITELYRQGVFGGNGTEFNVPISPMRLLMQNARYLGISTHPSATPQLIFTSTDKKADVTFKCALLDNVDITENDGTQDYLSTPMQNPLFLPKTIDFQTGLRLWNMDTINASLYKYFELYDKNANKTYKYYINDLSLRMTEVDSQEFSGLIKSIE